MTTVVPKEIRIKELIDVQDGRDCRNLAIQRVGIKDYKIPLEIMDRTNKQNSIANCSISTYLSPNKRGAHLSRFITFLCNNNKNMSFNSFTELSKKITKIQDSTFCHIELSFTFFKSKKAPVSGIKSTMDYLVTFISENVGNKQLNMMKVTVPVTSLCPCSKQISDYGAHNQRTSVSVTICPIQDKKIWIEDVIDIIENNASSELYSLLKREDVKYVTEIAYNNPKFVEDIVRDIAITLEKIDQLEGYRVEVENYESIHNHSAFALINKINN